MIAVHFLIQPVIRTEHNSVLVFQEELACAARLPAEFRFSRSEFNHHVRQGIEQMRNVVEVLRPVRHVERDKRGMRVFGEHVIALREQFLLRRKLRTVEAPVGMLDQLLIALIRVVDGMKKCLGIGR